MTEQIQKKSTNESSYYEDSSVYLKNCDESESSSMSTIIIESNSDFITNFLINKSDALAPMDELDPDIGKLQIDCYVPILQKI